MAEPLRAIDSNGVLRYLLRDDIDQWRKATRLIDSEQPLGLTVVALAEVAGTLRARYAISVAVLGSSQT